MADPPQRSPSSFRQRFAELSLEKKLSIFFVPVFAAVVGTLVPRFLGGGESVAPLPPAPPVIVTTEEEQEEPRESLEVLDLDVINSRKRSLDYGIGGELRVNVRNAGGLVSVIHAAEFAAAQFEEVELCLPPAGNLPASGTYNLILPSVDGGGFSTEVEVQQQVPAGEPDSFTFRAHLDDAYEPVNGDSRLYVLDVVLSHDVEQTVDAGAALLALPFPSADQFVYPAATWAADIGYFDPECPERNLARLRSLLELDVERSEQLERFAADPAEFADSNLDQLEEPSPADVAEAVGVGEAFIATLTSDEPKSACGLLNQTGVLQIEKYSDLPCAAYVEPLSALVADGGSLEAEEVHPGWIKLLAEPVGEGRLALILQETPPEGSGANNWEITNLYDVAVGPLLLNASAL